MSRKVFPALIAIFSLSFCALYCLPTVSSAQPPYIHPGAWNLAPAKGKTQGHPLGASKPQKIKDGDLVSVNFTAYDPKGAIVRTTYKKMALDPRLLRAAPFKPAPVYAPEEIIAGRGASIPGLAQAVIGMMAGQRKKVVLKPGETSAAPPKRQQIPCTRIMPRQIKMSPEEFVAYFHRFPVVGKEVPVTPYFKAAVTQVTENFAVLDCKVKDIEHFQESYGAIETMANKQEITIVLKPSLGADFPMAGGKTGKITATDGMTFTVEAINPLADVPLTVDMDVVSVTPAASLDALKIPWIDDYAKGLALAKQEKKPVVLVLYADWCHFCKKLFAQTLTDPRVEVLKDRFVWIRVNSDKNKNLKEQFAQKGFPLIVILDRDGKPMDRMDGFKDAMAFRDELLKTPKAL